LIQYWKSLIHWNALLFVILFQNILLFLKHFQKQFTFLDKFQLPIIYHYWKSIFFNQWSYFIQNKRNSFWRFKFFLFISFRKYFFL
jgi:hypothetical protein